MAGRRADVNDPETSGVDRDADLIRRIRAGDRPAFLEFYDRYATLLLSVAARVLGDRREAEDVLQDVCTQIWQQSSAYDPVRGALAGWAVTLTRHKAIDRIRASNRRRRLLDEIATSPDMAAATVSSANELLLGTECATRVRTALETLPGEQREAIELAFFGGLSQSEVASRLQQPLGTIKARIRRGMLKLRELLGDAL
jgi:RNA polymerase sigma-70 factor (ECF subfamily)